MWSPVCELGEKKRNNMKIKTKKQMNLPQLIEWAWSNPEQVKSNIFQSDKDNLGGYVVAHFSIDGHGFYTKGVTDTDTFTVEVEEEITEDTKFKHLVFIDDCDLSASYENKSINEIKYGHDKEFHANIDGEFKLIWTREKGLVE